MKITKTMVKTFADLSGDHNLIHINEEYAKGTRFKKCIVHGTFISGIIGTKIAKTCPICQTASRERSMPATMQI